MSRVKWSPAESQELQVASFLPTAETQGPPPLQRTGPDGDQIRVSAGEYQHWIDRHIVKHLGGWALKKGARGWCLMLNALIPT